MKIRNHVPALLAIPLAAAMSVYPSTVLAAPEQAPGAVCAAAETGMQEPSEAKQGGRKAPAKGADEHRHEAPPRGGSAAPS